MKRIHFEDILHPNGRIGKDLWELKSQSIKQISRGKFENKKDCIETRIEVNSVLTIVFFTNETSSRDFSNNVFTCNDEPSVEYLYKKTLVHLEKPLLELINLYKLENIKKGSELSEKLWFKLYSLEKIEDSYRDLYHATWIDYEKQLIKTKNIIFDENDLCGVWAFPPEMVLSCLNEECLKRYGNHLFILGPVSDCEYLIDDKEIIGSKYLVLDKINLTKIDGINILCKSLLEIDKKKYELELEESNKERRALQNKNIEISDKLREILLNNQKLGKIFKRERIIYSVVGLFIGIIISFILLRLG